MLAKLFHSLKDLRVPNQVELSILIVDNDFAQSARSIVEKFQTQSNSPIKYLVEPIQNIALARNMAIKNAKGDYIAFVDDDETVSPQWIEELYKNMLNHNTDGVFGAVFEKYIFDPPIWLRKGKFFNRRTNLKTGDLLSYKQTGSGNCLLSKKALERFEGPFNSNYGQSGGEDTTLFKKMLDSGSTFVCASDAITYEWIPKERASLKYLLRRSFVGGFIFARQLELGSKGIFLKSKFIMRTSVLTGYYLVLSLFNIFFGYHKFVQCLLGISIQMGKFRALLKPFLKEYGDQDKSKLEFVKS